MDIRELAQRADRFSARLKEAQASLADEGIAWYPFDSAGNFFHLDALLEGKHRDLAALAGAGEVLDIGCADGFEAFFLESLGMKVHAIDHAATNYNGMRGVRRLKEALGSRVEIDDIDLDTQFRLPGGTFRLALFFGILYHLKNPFYALERLARQAEYCLLSTRIARFAEGKDLSALPVGYLVGAAETNADPTNYWIFSGAGLRRLLDRTQWEIREYLTTGARGSNPASREGDERAFCLARSRILRPPPALTRGWHGPEEGGWRWTERRFAARFSEVQAERPAALRLEFLLPEAVLAAGGTQRVSARVNGFDLPPREYREAGRSVYTAAVPAGVLPDETALAEFELSAALGPEQTDGRELGVVVAAVTLEWSELERGGDGGD
jgi:SAM-dependent methyltransferase